MKRRWWALTAVGAAIVAAAAMVGPTIYRVTHGLDRYETVPPALPPTLRQPAILVFSKTNGYRDATSIDAANAMFASLAREKGWGIVFSENGAIFNPEQLARFRTVVWSSVSGDVLTAEQREAFRRYIENGGGFVGIHGAGGDPSYRWRWYVDDLIGAQFVGHTMWPQKQRGTILVEDAAHPVMKGLPHRWVRDEEWYSFQHSVRGKPGYHVLATVDEGTYTPKGMFRDDLRMGADHPVVWTHCVGRGRAFYSALGHFPASYSEPLHRQMLASAIQWTADPNHPECAH